MKKILRLIFALLLIGLFVSACAIDAGPPSEESSVPSGDPPFPAFTGSWVIDTTGEVSEETISKTNEVLNALRSDGIAEVVILVITDVNHPELYATRFGRHVELGSAETDNGVVYIVRPDGGKDEHIIYSIGRGLPKYTSGRVTDAMLEGSTFANQGNIDAAILALAEGTNEVLRKLYEPRPETVTEDGEAKDELTPEQQKAAAVTFLVIVGVWIGIGFLILPFDAEFAVQWWMLGLRILILVLTAGKASGKSTGGSGKFGGRSGSR